MDNDQKDYALKEAVEIAKLYVQAGLEKDSPAKVIRETYAAIEKIKGNPD